MNRLTIQEYQVLAKRTCSSLGSLEKDLLHMRLGIITEVGEVLDIFKKELAYNKPIDKVNLGEEIADIAWYLVNEATFRGQECHIPLREYNTNSLHNLIYLDIALEEDNWDISTALGFLNKFCIEHSLNFEECLYKNIEKLKVRYPDKFTEEAALNRNLDKERKVLE